MELWSTKKSNRDKNVENTLVEELSKNRKNYNYKRNYSFFSFVFAELL